MYILSKSKVLVELALILLAAQKKESIRIEVGEILTIDSARYDVLFGLDQKSLEKHDDQK